MSRLNPLTKLYLLLLSNIMLFVHVDTVTEASMTTLFILPFFLHGKSRTGIKLFIIYYGCLLTDIVILPFADGFILVLLSLFAVSIRMMLPCIIAGAYAFSTTTISEFVCTMRKLHIPECVIIPCMVIVRFFPTIKEDYMQIKNAMAFRGIVSGGGSMLLRPVQTLEYVLMPLLMNGNNVAQDLSVSSLTKGIGLKGTHTCMTQIKMNLQDVIYMAICTMPLIIFIAR
ncbi:energy-coupling factor transporter transmembrane component T [Anaerosporobacter sp.]